MKAGLAGLITVALLGCQGDETVRAYGGGDRTWLLQEIDGKAYPARASLSFPEPGRIAGAGPCNSFTADMQVPYPWFESGPIAATRSTCPDLAAETAYFEGLARASLSEVAGDTLILSDPDGFTMVFSAVD